MIENWSHLVRRIGSQRSNVSFCDFDEFTGDIIGMDLHCDGLSASRFEYCPNVEINVFLKMKRPLTFFVPMRFDINTLYDYATWDFDLEVTEDIISVREASNPWQTVHSRVSPRSSNYLVSLFGEAGIDWDEWKKDGAWRDWCDNVRLINRAIIQLMISPGRDRFILPDGNKMLVF